MKKNKYLIVIGGPTASGKTSVAIELARHFHTAIVSADSRQFYRQMNIGTAKPSPQELAAAPHHFINALDVEEDYSAGDFERDALTLLDQLYTDHQVVVLAGGSGLFIRAVCEGLDHFPEVPDEIKNAVDQLYRSAGITALQSELKERDPDYFREVDILNPHRLMRALCVCRVSGQPFSSFRKRSQSNRPFQPLYILLEWDREALYDRINKRVDQMMEMGLLEEVRQLYPKRHLNALQTVGYQELFQHIESKTTREEAVEKIKQNSRRYAKRQMTWFRKRDHWQSFHPSDMASIIDYLESAINAL